MSIGGMFRRTFFFKTDKKLYNNYLLCKKQIIGYNGCIDDVNKKLSDLLTHAIKTTDYYSKLNLNSRLNDFPVINKLTICENRKQMISREYLNKPVHTMSTSGSTGIPFIIQQDMQKRNLVIAEIKAFNDLAKYPSHEKMLYLLGSARKSKPFSKKQEFRENIYRCPISVNDDETMKELYDFIKYKRPVAIHASASNLPPLVEYINEHKKIKNCSVKTVITGGENVPVALRLSIENALGKQCKVFVKYSNEEMGILGMDTGADTPYILNWANYWFEILKIDSNEPCAENELGRIVITDLNNYALPLIRYDTGDIGSLKTITECYWPVLNNLSGKVRDLIYDTNGFSISGATITNLLKNIKNVAQWQLIQETCCDYTFKVVCKKDKSASYEDILLDDLQNLLGKKAKISVEFSNEIPLTQSGKRRYTVNNYKPQ